MNSCLSRDDLKKLKQPHIEKVWPIIFICNKHCFLQSPEGHCNVSSYTIMCTYMGYNSYIVVLYNSCQSRRAGPPAVCTGYHNITGSHLATNNHSHSDSDTLTMGNWSGFYFIYPILHVFWVHRKKLHEQLQREHAKLGPLRITYVFANHVLCHVAHMRKTSVPLNQIII